jgi:hypothetical protein
MKTFPYIPEELFKALEEAFPDRLPADHIETHHFAVLIGQQQVIRFLRARLALQQKPERNL